MQIGAAHEELVCQLCCLWYNLSASLSNFIHSDTRQTRKVLRHDLTDGSTHTSEWEGKGRFMRALPPSLPRLTWNHVPSLDLRRFASIASCLTQRPPFALLCIANNHNPRVLGGGVFRRRGRFCCRGFGREQVNRCSIFFLVHGRAPCTLSGGR